MRVSASIQGKEICIGLGVNDGEVDEAVLSLSADAAIQLASLLTICARTLRDRQARESKAAMDLMKYGKILGV